MPSAFESKRKTLAHEPEEEERMKEQAKKVETNEVQIAAPLTFWIGFLVLGVILVAVVVPVANTLGVGSMDKYVTLIANYIIYLPGSIILPLVAALLIGERVGASKKKSGVVLYSGVINALYAILVYIVAIFIIYLAVKYSGSSFLASVNITDFIEYLIVIPVAITVVLVPLFALISYARRKE
ncbi:MAG TPA: hypothetical protein VND15_02930 [Candidatus Acidoferrales bacterium]|nr:hypothetical protein [Candidatus Acidoferrales bacterium]